MAAAKATNRRSVVHKGSRIPGLWERRTTTGAVRFELTTRIRGRFVRRVLEASTVTEALRERARLVTELAAVGAPTPTAGAAVTFATARAAYVEHLRGLAATGERSSRSVSAASARLARLDSLDEYELSAIGSPELAGAAAALRNRRYAAWTVRTTLAAFSAVWTYSARERGWCSEAARPTLASPVRITRTNARQARRLNEGQLAELVGSATEAGRPLAALLAYTGLRLSEVLALTWADLDLVDGLARVERQLDEHGKPTELLKAESSRRSVPIPAPLAAILTEHLAAELALDRGRTADFVLMSARGAAYTKRRALVLFGKAATKAELGDLRPHDCRHTYGSLLLARGVPLPAVSRLLGHSNPQTTARVYAGVLEERDGHTRALVRAAFGIHEVSTEAAGELAEELDSA